MTGKHISTEQTAVARPSAQPRTDARRLPWNELIDVSAAARTEGFRLPVFITARAHGLVVKPGTPVGEGLWSVLETAYTLHRNRPAGAANEPLRFYMPWLQGESGVVSLVLERHGAQGGMNFFVIATYAERR